MDIIEYSFWISILLVGYSYFGYAAIIFCYLKLKRKKRKKNENSLPLYQPPVSIIVAAYNEEVLIESKIKNCLELNYPASKIKFVFVADGSTDKTVDIIKLYPQIELHYLPERKGKVAAINRIMTKITTDFVVFCDANTMLNKDSIVEIVKHYVDEKIGGVAGEKKVILSKGSKHSGTEGEGLYWRYESKLKQIDSDFYSVVGAAGELFSIRTKLFEPLATNILLDDFIMSMNICKKGYKIIYEPKSYALETASITMKDEQNRKIRISAGGFQSVIMLKDVLNILKYGRLSYLYISHRVFRWVLCPLLLPIIFLLNMFLLRIPHNLLYQSLFVAQLAFYSTASLGWVLIVFNKKVSLFYTTYYFVFMNLTMYLGLIRYINNEQTVLWIKAARK